MIFRGNREDESLFVVAELYLSELASRSLVQVQLLDVDAKSGTKYLKCKFHDVVRELCLSIGKREGFGLQSLDCQGGKLMHGSLSGFKTRHLAIHFDGGKVAITRDEHTCKHVRSLVLSSNEKKIEFRGISIDLRLFKLLRVLHFRRLKFGRRKLPKGIGNLIHLRYLRFDDCELDKLPSSIKNLSYLQTLNLETSWDDVRVPDVLNKLPRLRDYALALDEGLDELETLTGLDSSMHRLKSITRLKNLQAFGATLRDNESLLAAMDAFNYYRLEQVTVLFM